MGIGKFKLVYSTLDLNLTPKNNYCMQNNNISQNFSKLFKCVQFRHDHKSFKKKINEMPISISFEVVINVCNQH